jgi:hypothetical protein
MSKSGRPLLVVALFLGVVACLTARSNARPSKQQPTQAAGKGVVYVNKQYGFRFSLPNSWKGYSIIVGQWSGRRIDKQDESAPSETGSLISIRHPLWTEANPRQDIPIMVFSLAQWDLVEHDKLVVNPAPFGPNEIGRNSRYVFAIPPRYEYAFPTGWEEVAEILGHHPLRTY